MASQLLDCAIGKLPPELLEKVLLRVVQDIAPFDHDAPHRQLFHVEQDHSISHKLAFRATCSVFRNLSWRALAKVLNATMFDIRSRESIQNLESISKIPPLAPWITELNFACYATPSLYPYEASEEYLCQDVAALEPDCRKKFEQIKKAEQAWNREYWSLPPGETDTPTIGDVSSSRHRQNTFALEVKLASHVARLKNVECLRYVHKHATVPGRYRRFDLHSRLSLAGLCTWEHDEVSEPYAQIGLDVILSALAFSDARPHTLELAVELHEHHVIISHLARSVIRDIFQHVETLCLLSRYRQGFSNSNAQPDEARVAVTDETLPALRSLTIDHRDGLWGQPNLDAFPLPAATEVPVLTHLAVRNAPMESPWGIPLFVERYGSRLTSLELHCVDGSTWERIINTLRKIRPENLMIKHEDDRFWASFRNHSMQPPHYFGILESLPPRVLASLASKIVISPLGLVEALEKHWGTRDTN